MLYNTVQCYGDVFKLIFWKFFFYLRNNGTAMAVLAAPLPAALTHYIVWGSSSGIVDKVLDSYFDSVASLLLLLKVNPSETVNCALPPHQPFSPRSGKQSTPLSTPHIHINIESSPRL